MPHSRRGEIPKSEWVATRRSEASLGDEKGSGDLKPCFVGGCFPLASFTASLSVRVNFLDLLPS